MSQMPRALIRRNIWTRTAALFQPPRIRPTLKTNKKNLDLISAKPALDYFSNNFEENSPLDLVADQCLTKSPPKISYTPASLSISEITQSIEATTGKVAQIFKRPSDEYENGFESMVLLEHEAERMRIHLAEDLIRMFKPFMQAGSIQSEGLRGPRPADWIVLDLRVALVHIVSPEISQEYALVKLWSERPEPPRPLEEILRASKSREIAGRWGHLDTDNKEEKLK